MSETRAWLPLVLALLLLAGFAVAVPPLMLRAFVAAQRRIGNGGHPAVARVARHASPIAYAVWAIWALGALGGLPPFFRDAADAADAAAASATSSALVGEALVTVPAADTPPREALLDAVRARLGVTSRFSVEHVAMTATDRPYAFVAATEVVAGDDGETQETDLSLLAFLERSDAGAWRVVELWTLPDDAEHPRGEFARRVRARQAAARLPAALFPGDL